MAEPGVWHKGPDEHALATAVDRARELVKVLDVEHHPTDLYRALRGVRHELDTMARMLPAVTPPASPAAVEIDLEMRRRPLDLDIV